MPEGPSIVILKEAVQSFAGQKILRVEGNSKKVDFARLVYARITDFKGWVTEAVRSAISDKA